VVLKHATVSRRHAEIRPEQDGFVLVDAGSQNGTYLGDNRITSTTLAGGDDIIIGVFRLTFHNSADPSETGTGTGQPG
jgi:pSer/pThr/pTyr-binding forkhead associated (FHA) protein